MRALLLALVGVTIAAPVSAGAARLQTALDLKELAALGWSPGDVSARNRHDPTLRAASFSAFSSPAPLAPSSATPSLAVPSPAATHPATSRSATVRSATACREALALGLDVSGSVDDGEYRLQLDGLAEALGDPAVRAALLDMPDTPIRLLVYEWSGPRDQRLLAPWTEITGTDALNALQDRLRNTQRVAMDPSTALGTAMTHGAALLTQQPECWQRVLDISGDGIQNTGPHPGHVAVADITVNGLVIATEGGAEGIAKLSAYFRAYVLRGPGAFVETTGSFRDYRSAMTRKLLRELQLPSVAVLGRPPGAATAVPQ